MAFFQSQFTWIFANKAHMSHPNHASGWQTYTQKHKQVYLSGKDAMYKECGTSPTVSNINLFHTQWLTWWVSSGPVYIWFIAYAVRYTVQENNDLDTDITAWNNMEQWNVTPSFSKIQYMNTDMDMPSITQY